MKRVAYISYYIVAIIYMVYISIVIFNKQITKDFFPDNATIFIFVCYGSMYQIQEAIYEKYNTRKNIYTVVSIINIISIVIFLVSILWINKYNIL